MRMLGWLVWYGIGPNLGENVGSVGWLVWYGIGPSLSENVWSVGWYGIGPSLSVEECGGWWLSGCVVIWPNTVVFQW